MERETRRGGVETPSRQTVGGVSCLPGICVLRLPRLAIGRPASPVATNPWAFLGFRPRLASTPHGSGQRRAPLSPVTRRQRQERESERKQAAVLQPGKKLPPPPSSPLFLLDIVVSFLGPISSPPPAPPFPLRFLLLPLASPPPRSVSCGVGGLRR